jgi:hypothetical protein
MAGLKSVQSSAAAAEEEPRYGNPIRVGTVAPPSPALLSEPSARLLASMARSIGRQLLTSASLRMSILLLRDVADDSWAKVRRMLAAAVRQSVFDKQV